MTNSASGYIDVVLILNRNGTDTAAVKHQILTDPYLSYNQNVAITLPFHFTDNADGNPAYIRLVIDNQTSGDVIALRELYLGMLSGFPSLALERLSL